MFKSKRVPRCLPLRPLTPSTMRSRFGWRSARAAGMPKSDLMQTLCISSPKMLNFGACHSLNDYPQSLSANNYASSNRCKQMILTKHITQEDAHWYDMIGPDLNGTLKICDWPKCCRNMHVLFEPELSRDAFL